MEFHQNLAALMEARGFTNYRLAQLLDVSQSTIANWVNGTSTPRRATMKSIADLFSVPVEQLVGANNAPALDASSITPQDMKIISAYHHATPPDKAIIDNIVERYADVVDIPRPATKVIPLFGTSAAAGPGEPDTELPWEDYEVPANSRSEFAVRVTGDSMEPELHDGQIALCVKRMPKTHDIAVLMVNGCVLVKQYIRDYYGNVYLRSLNRRRKDCDYDISASGNDTVMCYGTVIVDHNIPLAE